jgi:short-subunit dehydrogenase
LFRKRVLITGASSGLGAEMARQFAAKGHDLALCARRLDRLEGLRADILAKHRERTVLVRQLDVDDHDAVFAVFEDVCTELDGIDRIIVNAGIGKGAQIGTGRFDANRQTAMTNFVSALAQCEAGMQIFRRADAGHLVVIASMGALRGLPRALTTYAASKAGLAALAEGLRADVLGSPIAVSTIYPGYIASEMNEKVDPSKAKGMVPTDKGVRAMVDAIEKEKDAACVPPLPWAPMSVLMKHAPLGVLKRVM